MQGILIPVRKFRKLRTQRGSSYEGGKFKLLQDEASGKEVNQVPLYLKDVGQYSGAIEF